MDSPHDQSRRLEPPGTPAGTKARADTLRVAVYAADSAEPSQRKAAQLAEQLCLPQATSVDSAYDALLTVTAERLELRFTQPGAPKPLFVDFVGGPLGYARRLNRFGLLYRAVGFRTGRPTVLDATAGLGADAFRLAWHGCQVTAVERCPVLFALLRDGLERAAAVPDIHQQLGDRLQLRHGDARNDLQKLITGEPLNPQPLITSEPPDPQPLITAEPPDSPPATPVDVVYLDPMYPPRAKSALPKVEMRILRQLVGDDLDADTLFTLARAAARQRVVVKRPRHAPPLAPDPTHSYCDTTTRYDVYIR